MGLFPSCFALSPCALSASMTNPPPSIWPLMVGSLSGSMALMGLNAVFGPALRHFGIADWQAGAMLSLAGVFMMISGAPWGRISNRLGRKKVVLIGLTGMGATLLVLAAIIEAGLNAAIGVTAITLALFVLRSAMNFSYGAVPVAAQAWVADHTPSDKRSSAMAAIGAAQGLGMILGPALAALLSRLGLGTPFWVVGFTPLLGALAVALFLPSSQLPARSAGEGRLSILDPRIRRAVLTAFSCMFVIMTAQLTVGFLAIDILKLPPNKAAGAAGAALTSVGVAFLIAQVLVAKRGWPARRLALTGAPIAAMGFFVTPLVLQAVPAAWVMCAGFFSCAMGLGILWPAFQAEGANAVNPEEQGEAAGHNTSVMGAASVLGPLIAGFLYSVSPLAPYMFDALMLACLILVWRKGSVR
jgi:MFS transporter, DHA1 family, tetracycline resistance protein